MNCDEAMRHILRKYGGAISGWLLSDELNTLLLYMFSMFFSCFISTQYRNLKIAATDGDTIFSTNRTLLFFIACTLMSLKC